LQLQEGHDRVKAKSEPDDISYSAKAPCEKFYNMLGPMAKSTSGKAKDEPNVVSYDAGATSSRREPKREEGEGRAQRHPLQRWDRGDQEQWQRICEKGEKWKAKLEPASDSQATENSEREKREAKIESNTICYSAETSTCEKKVEAKLEPNIPNPIYSPYRLVPTAGSANTSWAMWRARAEIADKWLAGGEAMKPQRKETPKSKPTVISHSTGSEDSHQRWLKRKFGKRSVRSADCEKL